MGYIVEYKDGSTHDEVLNKVLKAKKAICEAYDALEESEEYAERNGMNYRHNLRNSMGYRGDDWREEQMDMRRGGRYRY